jgi:hypothetical protein
MFDATEDNGCNGGSGGGCATLSRCGSGSAGELLDNNQIIPMMKMMIISGMEVLLIMQGGERPP